MAENLSPPSSGDRGGSRSKGALAVAAAAIGICAPQHRDAPQGRCRRRRRRRSLPPRLAASPAHCLVAATRHLTRTLGAVRERVRARSRVFWQAGAAGWAGAAATAPESLRRPRAPLRRLRADGGDWGRAGAGLAVPPPSTALPGHPPIRNASRCGRRKQNAVNMSALDY